MQEDLEVFRAYAVHLTAEHRRIAQCMRQIEEQLQLVHVDPHVTLVHVTENLAQLRTELSKHFADEESGGCLEEAVVHLPSLTDDVARVLNEHPSFLSEIDRLIEQIGPPGRSKLSLNDVNQEFQKFAQRLRVHEAAENRILQESFCMEGQ